MSKRKMPVMYPAGDPFEGFSDAQWGELAASYGREFSDNLKLNLKNAVAAWLFTFEFQHGPNRSDVLGQLKTIQSTAKKLRKALLKLDALGEDWVDFALPKNTRREALFLYLTSLGDAENIGVEWYFELGTPLAQAHLVQGLKLEFELESYSVTVTHGIRPSGFVRFLDKLRSIEPRLKIYRSRESDTDEAALTAFSQWVSRRLSEEISSSETLQK